MLFTNALLVVPMMAALTFGAALPEPNPADLEARADTTTMTAYVDTDYQGRSKDFEFTIGGSCQALAGSDFDDSIRSVWVREGYHCRLWQSESCDKKSTGDIYAPGSPSLPLNGKISSFKCYRN